VSAQADQNKRAMRASLKDALTAIDPGARARAADEVARRIRELPEYHAACTLLAYAALPGELNLDPLIRAAWDGARRVAVPRVDWETTTMEPALIENLDTDLVEGRYGVRSPAPRCAAARDHEITLALVPGLAFDPQGGRLGRGAGFYDRWISARRVSGGPIEVVGVCFDEQLVERVPRERHDQGVDTVVTPTRTIRSTHG